MKIINADKIIIGGGLYGLYSAIQCGKKGERIVVLEYEDKSFKRATYINQARVHMGYHYPRSISTAAKSAYYFEHFCKDYSDCILTDFKQIYATSSKFSYTNAEQFLKFCKAVNIKCEEISPDKYFKKGMCDGAFITQEYTYDAKLLLKKLLCELEKYQNVTLIYHARINRIYQNADSYFVELKNNSIYKSKYILNATYASVNQILEKVEGFEKFPIKYELCEIILCNTGFSLKNVGLTVMDGPFFSIMPFGKTKYHSLTSVTFTPHNTSYQPTPIFECQQKCEPTFCTGSQLGNCNECIAKPDSAWNYMSFLAKKYMNEDLEFNYYKSLYSIKPILRSSEIDDSRPTVIKIHTQNPTFVSVLSGKINTVYDLNEVLI